MESMLKGLLDIRPHGLTDFEDCVDVVKSLVSVMITSFSLITVVGADRSDQMASAPNGIRKELVVSNPEMGTQDRNGRISRRIQRQWILQVGPFQKMVFE
jgi:hypothetical protein